MIYPIVAYGDPVLKKMATDIEQDYPKLDKLIKDMFETMDNAPGVGLAAPQIGKSIRVFVVDASHFAEDAENPEDAAVMKDFRKVFINAHVVEETGEEWAFEEGCLSIPNIREDVYRKPSIRLRYRDENWEEHEETFTGLPARIIQHEYDHIDGVLFTDHIKPLTRRLLSRKLANIAKGKVKVDYRMRFPLKK